MTDQPHFEVLDIPDGATPAQASYVRGAFLLKSLFEAYGERDIVPGSGVLPSSEVIDALAFAMAIQLANDDRCNSPRDVRHPGDDIAKRVKQLTNSMLSESAKAATFPGLRSIRPN